MLVSRAMISVTEPAGTHPFELNYMSIALAQPEAHRAPRQGVSVIYNFVQDFEGG